MQASDEICIAFSRALYGCRAANMSSVIRFSLVRPPLDIVSNKLLESLKICNGIVYLKTNFNCLRIASASSKKSANAIISPDNTERVTHRDLYDL